ncbi:hypothetical protein PsorP6_005599 [Peronosclerospora sorghi]|uniref:Uncharacterized protein n=1 Tax=Peronosclerospora sorghi TaxID=230839 RepID=A0ACC0W4H0_9STRA|nr:hypothetical protein PsorP6_005599 [Peronosclerospora sorghi]
MQPLMKSLDTTVLPSDFDILLPRIGKPHERWRDRHHSGQLNSVTSPRVVDERCVVPFAPILSVRAYRVHEGYLSEQTTEL